MGTSSSSSWDSSCEDSEVITCNAEKEASFCLESCFGVVLGVVVSRRFFLGVPRCGVSGDSRFTCRDAKRAETRLADILLVIQKRGRLLSLFVAFLEKAGKAMISKV